MVESTLLTERGEPQNVLLVEGNDDAYIMRSLLSHYRIPYVFRGLPEYEQAPKGLIRIRDHEGIDNLLEALEVEMKQSGEKRLGVIVDADTNLAARWQSLRNKLIQTGYSAVQVTPDPEGTIVKQEDKSTVGLWLMPNNVLPGMLEDFVSYLVPSGDLLWPIAEHILSQVIATDRRFSQEHESKARIYTWLAWQKKPGMPMGRAITARYLNANTPHAQQLMIWIRKLFGLEQYAT